MNKLTIFLYNLSILLLIIFGVNYPVYANNEKDLKTNLLIEGQNFELSQLEFNPHGSLDHFLIYTASNNPAIKSAYYQVKAAYEKLGYSGSLPDPIFSIGYFIESIETRVGPQNKKYGIKQTIPWLGTLSSKKNIAYVNALIEYQKFQAIKFKVFYQVKQAYYNYYLLGREYAITKENLELLRFWESVTRTKYKLALSQHPDLIKVQLELGQLEDNLLTLNQLISSSQTRLKTLMNLPDSLVIPIPDSIDIDETVLQKKLIIQLVLDNNPEINSLHQILKREEHSISLASKQSYPNLTFGIDYIETGEALNPTMRESGKDPWMVSVGFNIPLWFGKNNAKKKEAIAQKKAADQNLNDKNNELKYYVEHLLVEYDDYLRKMQLYRDGLIPKAQQLLNATYTSYQANKTDFLNLLDAQRQLLKLQLENDRALTNLSVIKAQLEMLSAQKLN